jgi:hypothetical protein
LPCGLEDSWQHWGWLNGSWTLPASSFLRSGRHRGPGWSEEQEELTMQGHATIVASLVC